MKDRIKRLLAPLRRGAQIDRIGALEQRIAELESSVDELRHDSLRVAELIDIAEHALTPGHDGN